MPRGHVRQRLLLMSDRRSIGRSAQPWSADTHWAVCTALSSGCHCWGPGSPRATTSSSQRRMEVPFQSRSRGWRGGFMGLRPNTAKWSRYSQPCSAPGAGKAWKREELRAPRSISAHLPARRVRAPQRAPCSASSPSLRPPVSLNPLAQADAAKGLWLVPVNSSSL